MASILGQLIWPFHKNVKLCRLGLPPADPGVLQLQAAKAILSEVFAIDISEVEEMIRRRCDDLQPSRDRELWPDRLWVVE